MTTSSDEKNASLIDMKAFYFILERSLIALPKLSHVIVDDTRYDKMSDFITHCLDQISQHEKESEWRECVNHILYAVMKLGNDIVHGDDASTFHDSRRVALAWRLLAVIIERDRFMDLKTWSTIRSSVMIHNIWKTVTGSIPVLKEEAKCIYLLDEEWIEKSSGTAARLRRAAWLVLAALCACQRNYICDQFDEYKVGVFKVLNTEEDDSVVKAMLQGLANLMQEDRILSERLDLFSWIQQTMTSYFDDPTGHARLMWRLLALVHCLIESRLEWAWQGLNSSGFIPLGWSRLFVVCQSDSWLWTRLLDVIIQWAQWHPNVEDWWPVTWHDPITYFKTHRSENDALLRVFLKTNVDKQALFDLVCERKQIHLLCEWLPNEANSILNWTEKYLMECFNSRQLLLALKLYAAALQAIGVSNRKSSLPIIVPILQRSDMNSSLLDVCTKVTLLEPNLEHVLLNESWNNCMLTFFSHLDWAFRDSAVQCFDQIVQLKEPGSYLLLNDAFLKALNSLDDSEAYVRVSAVILWRHCIEWHNINTLPMDAFALFSRANVILSQSRRDPALQVQLVKLLGTLMSRYSELKLDKSFTQFLYSCDDVEVLAEALNLIAQAKTDDMNGINDFLQSWILDKNRFISPHLYPTFENLISLWPDLHTRQITHQRLLKPVIITEQIKSLSPLEQQLISDAERFLGFDLLEACLVENDAPNERNNILDCYS